MNDCIGALKAIQERMHAAARSVGRDPQGITLVAVSKTQPKEKVAELISAGQRDFGESTLQDAMTKIPCFEPSDAVWHFVGHLQSNKAKDVAGHFSWVHAVDSVKLATKISDAALQANCHVNILLQVNITNDPNKFGLSPDSVFSFVEALLNAQLSGVVLKGLMTIGPRGADRSGLQQAFSKMNVLQESCAQRFGAEYFQEISMGMSEDFEVAITEGATMVRVGTGIFGARDYDR